MTGIDASRPGPAAYILARTGGWRYGWLHRLAVLAFVCCCAAAFAEDALDGNGGNATQRSEGRQSEDLKAARKLIDSGAYSQALPRLINITSRDADSPQAAEAYYLTALAYRRIGSLTDASNNYTRCLELAPEGPRAAECKAALETIRSEVDAAFVSDDELSQLVAKMEERVKANPSDIANRLLLADLYWKQASYDAAGKLYAQLLGSMPGLYQDSVVAQRMQRQADGSWKILTPAEVVRQGAEANPLVVYGTNSFNTRELRGDLRYYTVDFYHVSGYVVNQSTAPVKNVAVDVSIFGFGEKIFDVQTVQLGTISPGQHRSFAVRFDKFDNVFNVQRYECQVRYDQ